MAKKCKSCAKNAQVNGFEDAPYMEIAAAAVGGYAAGMLDNFLSKNADGTPKTGMVAESVMTRNALIAAAGVALTVYMKDDMGKGAGIGLTTYAFYQIIASYMTPDTTVAGMNGMAYIPNQQIMGFNTLPGNYGYAQPNINEEVVDNRMRIYDESRQKMAMMNEEMDDYDVAP